MGSGRTGKADAIDYKQAGVDIAQGNLAVDLIKPLAAATFDANVLKGIGSFASFYDVTDILGRYRHPVLVQSTDGVGTKITVCKMTGDYSTIGADLFAACCNDIVVHGATPFTFLDYIANERLDAQTVATIVASLAQACRTHHVALVGGETAEMPGTYVAGEHDLVGFVSGFVERARIVNGDDVVTGDAVLAIGSSGLHTNGFSLARKVLFERAGLAPGDAIDPSDPSSQTVGSALLAPHAIYVKGVLDALADGLPIKSMAHITGGGLFENVPRVLPKGLRAHVDPRCWNAKPIFTLIQQLGDVADTVMYRTFNMGVGLVLVTAAHEARAAVQALQGVFDLPVGIIGYIEEGGPETLIEGV